MPDLRGSQNKGTFYTQDNGVQARESEQVVTLPIGHGSQDACHRAAEYAAVAGDAISKPKFAFR